MKTVKVHLYGNELKWTHFSPLDPALEKAGIRAVEIPREADVCVARNWRTKSLFKYKYLLGAKKFLHYNDEPNWPGATQKKEVRKWPFFKIHVMVPENGEIYQNITNIFGWSWKRAPQEIPSGAKLHPARLLCMLARKGAITENSRRLKPDGHDLRGIRLHIAEQAREKGMADIFGIGWPDSARLGESRGGERGEWHDAKLPIMDGYGFALAMENTLLENYVTEKIWDAVQCNALPLYYGNDWIYSEFPQDSFIDVRKFNSAAELLKFTGSLSSEQIAHRMALCRAVYQRLFNAKRHMESEKRFLRKIVDRLISIKEEKI